MANIQAISDGELGLNVRNKLNAAIVEANKVDDKVNDNDARLTDDRTPIDDSVTNAKVAGDAAIDPTKIAGTAVINNDARLTDERVPTDGSVTNAKVAANAAIEPTKIAGTAVINNDSRLTNERTPTDDSVTNTKVAGDAAIDPTKIAGTAVINNDARLTDERVPTDDSVSTAKLQDESVTNSKLATIPTSRLKGRDSAGNGVVEDLQLSTVKTMLDLPNDTVSELEEKANLSGAAFTGGVRLASLRLDNITPSRYLFANADRDVTPKSIADVKTDLSLPNNTAADLTAVETTADGALQRSGGEMTGAITGDQSARLFRPQGDLIAASVSILSLDKNSFFEINAESPLTITLEGTSEPNVVREFMITNGGNDRLTILNSTGANIVVSGLGLLENGASFTVKSLGDAFTIRSRSNGEYVIVGGEFTLVE